MSPTTPIPAWFCQSGGRKRGTLYAGEWRIATKALRLKLASSTVCCIIASVFAALPAWARTPEEITAYAAPAVVKIVVYDTTGAKSGQGSGFFIGDGKIVTNAHVVQDAYSAKVHGSVGLYENITILKEDEDVDLALLQVSAAGEPGLRLAAARSRLRPGQRILAIGNPMGLDHTVSDGLISAVRGLPGEFQLVQISAPISPGSSGGPLLDMEGRVVGVTSAGISDGQNLNFAVGIETLQAFLSRNDSSRALEKAGEWVFWRAALKWVGNVILGLIALVFGEGGFGWLVLVILIMVITAIVTVLKWLWRVVSSPFRRKTAQGLHSPGDSVGYDRVSTSPGASPPLPPPVARLSTSQVRQEAELARRPRADRERSSPTVPLPAPAAYAAPQPRDASAEASVDDIQFSGNKTTCPHCHGVITRPAALDGELVLCYLCQKTFPLPAICDGGPPVDAPGPKGVDGWLLFFCVSLTILSPLYNLGQISMNWVQAQLAFAQFPSLKTAVMWENAGSIALVIYGFVVGCMIWSGNPNGREIAKKFLLIRLFGLIGIEFIAVALMRGVPSEVFASVIAAAVGAVFRNSIWFLIWWFYFKKSKRVRNTYAKSRTNEFGEAMRTPPLPSPLPESGAPSRGVSGESPIRHAHGAAAVKQASEDPERIWPVTWAAIIVGSGTVLLFLLWALVFRGSAPQQQAEEDQPPVNAFDQWAASIEQYDPLEESAESGDSAPAPQPVLQPTKTTPPPAPTSQNTATEPGLILDPAALYAKSRAAVATIETEDDFGSDAGQGSGFFIAGEQVGQFAPRHLDTVKGDAKAPRDGYFLTNYHVIRAAASAKIRMEVSGVQLDGHIHEVVMEREDLDLALLAVCLLPRMKPGLDLERDWAAAESKIPWWRSGVPTLGIAGGEDPVVGTKVYTIGSPQGLEATLSEGIVSGYRAGSELPPWLQFTAPVSPGSSGGPLLDSTGRVVGVVTALRRGGQNLNFAVPASEIRGFLNGRCNRRELWEGSGIEEEETHAYMDASFAARNDSESMGVDIRLLDSLPEGEFGTIERLIDGIPPKQLGEWEFLWHHARGTAAAARALKTWNQANDDQAFDAKMRQHPDHQKAVAAFRQAINLKPAFSPSYLGLAKCYSREKRLREGLAIADKLVEMMPHSTKAYHLRGVFYGELDQDLDAYRDLTKAAELGTTHADVYREIGETCRALGKNAEAVTAYETAIKLGLSFPYDSLCQFNCGLTYKRMGRYAEAIGAFKKQES